MYGIIITNDVIPVGAIPSISTPVGAIHESAPTGVDIEDVERWLSQNLGDKSCGLDVVE
jgi:hypothetical protein